MAETSKSYQRRLNEGWFDKYIKGKIIDIGVGRIDTYDGADPLTPDCDTFDKDNGDAHLMESIPNETYETVYNSHLIEHLEDPITAIQNWFRILKYGGHLIIAAPDRDSYERKKKLPSRWNEDHKYFLTLDRSEPPNTYGLKNLVVEALKSFNYVIEVQQLINSCTNNDQPEEHGNGEYQLEIVLKKLL